MCGCAEVIARAIVGFFDAVLRCFLSWFRSSPASAHRDPLVYRGRLGEVLSVSDEEKGSGGSRGSHDDRKHGRDIDEELRQEDPLVHRGRLGVGEVLSNEEKGGFGGSRGSHQHREHGRDIEEELRQEADYLKLCVTISQTPSELQNSSEINSETTNEVGNVSGIGGTSVCGINSSKCFKCHEDHALMTETEVPQVESVPREKSPFWNIKNRFSDCSGSPFPTPLVLTEDMQTPGTIYTSHTGSSLSRKRVCTCQQFVYPVLGPVKIKTQKKKVTVDSPPMLPPKTPKQINLGAGHIKQLQKTSPSSVPKVRFLKSPPICFPNENALYQEKETLSPEDLKCQTSRQKSHSNEKHAALSMTHWLKPSHPEDDNRGAESSSATNKLHDEKTLPTETPVFTAASELDDDVKNLTPKLPKAWDGNGIPNTVSKYKEDQKVSWHATPFEERLSRALSGESNHPRKLNSGNLFHVEGDNSIPNTTAKYKEDQKVSWHATPFKESLSRVLSFESNTPRFVPS